jgi:hypothetical protein
MVTGNLTRGSLIQSHNKHNDSAATQRLLCSPVLLAHRAPPATHSVCLHSGQASITLSVKPSVSHTFKRLSKPVTVKVNKQTCGQS